jgi:hypothetical protein
LAAELRNATKSYVEVEIYLLTGTQVNYLVKMLEEKGFSASPDRYNEKLTVTW